MDTGTPAQMSPAAEEERELGRLTLRSKIIIALVSISVVPTLFLGMFAGSTYERLIATFGADSPVVHARLQTLHIDFVVMAFVYLLFVGIGVVLADHFFAVPIRGILAWLHLARERKFAGVTPPPVDLKDELGDLGREIETSIKYFQEVEAREKQIAEEKGEFISVAAHQLRTPLTGLKWTLEVLREPATTPEDRAKLIDQVSGTADRMVRLVDDVLDVAKIEEGKFGYDYGRSDLVEPLQKLVNDFLVVAKSREVTLAFEHAEAASPVYMDVNRVLLAVSNLISNGIDYTAKGGKVTLRITPTGRQILISVQDTGIGISQEDQKRLFTKFYRGENARHMRPDGSGLGLYIVRNVALRHGGDVLVESETGKGSTFSFKIPLEQADLGKAEVSVGKFFGNL